LFRGWRYNLRVNSLLDGYSPGKVYVDDVEHPRTAIVWVKDKFYLGGDAGNAPFNAAIDGRLTATILPHAAAVGFSIDRIDTDLLGQPGSKIILQEIRGACVSVKRFVKRGLGFCVRRGQLVISSCYLMYVSGRAHEIAINTFDPEHRNKGFPISMLVWPMV
jgi:hypothetical protein